MKGTRIMRFVGNREKPEEDLFQFDWGKELHLLPPPLPVDYLDEFHTRMAKHILEALQIK
jgi:hypothetical protein